MRGDVSDKTKFFLIGGTRGIFFFGERGKGSLFYGFRPKSRKRPKTGSPFQVEKYCGFFKL